VLAVGLAVALIVMPTTQVSAGSGGTSLDGSGGNSGCGDAMLVDGNAKAPDCAPRRVKRVIGAANEITGKSYCYGGGHKRFKSRCYDCSGAVSYALHGGRFLDSPMDSSQLMRWARRGRGDWFTVYANTGHAFLVVAGLRFDTSMVRGDGPGWSRRIHLENLHDFRHRRKGRF
jgi:hypothetical protein